MIKLSQIFQDNMVLQREKNVKIWGNASKNACVTVSIQGQKVSAISDDKGEFKVILNNLKTSEKETLSISCEDEIIEYKNIAIGEVWIAGGQSNMEFWMHYEKHLNDVKSDCANKNIRYYETPKITYAGQNKDFDYSDQGIWRIADEDNINFFSAVSYYFSRVLNRELNCPIGVVGCSFGGTGTYAWMDINTVKSVGKPWIRDIESKTLGKDLNRFWNMQKTIPGNNTGKPFESEFNNTFLPRVVPFEEASAYMAKMFADGAGDMEFFGLTPMSFPASLYENMLKTIAPYSNRGVIWYQGESDDAHADIYAIMFSNLINDWRKLFEEETMPFLEVQLPAYESWCGYPQTTYHITRAAQQAVADAMANVYMTSISDAGEQFDIHPKDKLIPGERLALLALGRIYGQNILCEPPSPDRVVREENSIRIHFKNADGGLVVKDDNTVINALNVSSDAFSLAYSEGEDLIIRFDSLPKELVKIEFAMGEFYKVNLYNKADIPAVPFSLRA